MPANDYQGFGWIKVPKYVMDETLSWEDRYQALEAHHVRETTFLINKVRELAAELANLRAVVESEHRPD
ncbi:MAG: hypothetical protein K2Y37_18055 [Pirellulales bacterium]|nr:hypothetical protein [Pirellulales bacterium]